MGTGEYTTGFVGGGASTSDKKVGVVGLTLFDLRRRGKVGQLSMVGVSGDKFPAIRKSREDDQLFKNNEADQKQASICRKTSLRHTTGSMWTLTNIPRKGSVIRKLTRKPSTRFQKAPPVSLRMCDSTQN